MITVSVKCYIDAEYTASELSVVLLLCNISETWKANYDQCRMHFAKASHFRLDPRFSYFSADSFGKNQPKSGMGVYLYTITIERRLTNPVLFFSFEWIKRSQTLATMVMVARYASSQHWSVQSPDITVFDFLSTINGDPLDQESQSTGFLLLLHEYIDKSIQMFIERT